MKHTPQSGSAILWVLIAVALFAAVGFAMSYNSRTSTSIISGEQVRVYAQQIIAYGNEIKTAVKRLQLRGCTNEQISFQNSSAADPSWYENPNSPPDKSCHIFDVKGGGLAWQNLPTPYADMAGEYNYSFAANKYAFIGETEWAGSGTTCAAASCSDLIMIVHSTNFDKTLCNKINQLLDLPLDISDAKVSGTPYKGTFSFITGSTFADESTSVSAAGKSAACFYRTSDNIYIYMTLLANR